MLSTLGVRQSRQPTTIIRKLIHVQLIVNVTWKLEGNSMAKLSRWIRCLFQIALTSDAYVAEHLLEQIADIVKDAKVRCSTLVASPPPS